MAVGAVCERLVRALGRRARVRGQSAFAASDTSEPEPDIAVVPYRSYREAHPAAAYLIVEVGRTSLAKDRNVKDPLMRRPGETLAVARFADVTLPVADLFSDGDG